MPVNVWRHNLFLTDVIGPLSRREGDFDELRIELVRRIRAADFYDETNIVLRNVVADIEATGCVEQLDLEWRLFTMWCDMDENRVWLETVFTQAEIDARRKGQTA